MHPLTKHLAEQLPDQDNFRCPSAVSCSTKGHSICFLQVHGAGRPVFTIRYLTFTICGVWSRSSAASLAASHWLSLLATLQRRLLCVPWPSRSYRACSWWPDRPCCSGRCPQLMAWLCRSIICDQYLRVQGGNGSIYALGDAATIAQPRALEHAQVMRIQGYGLGSGSQCRCKWGRKQPQAYMHCACKKPEEGAMADPGCGPIRAVTCARDGIANRRSCVMQQPFFWALQS